jgi:hypothetical protein
LTSALVGGEWSASRPGRFTPGDRAPGTHWIRGWVDPRADLDDVEWRIFLTSPGLELRPLGRPASRYTDCAIPVLLVYILPPALGMEFCWKIRCMFEKLRPNTSNVTRKESTAFKSLKDNTQIRILQVDRGNCTVVLTECARSGDRD